MFEAILTRFEGLEVDGDPPTCPGCTRTSSTASRTCPSRWTAITEKR